MTTKTLAKECEGGIDVFIGAGILAITFDGKQASIDRTYFDKKVSDPFWDEFADEPLFQNYIDTEKYSELLDVVVYPQRHLVVNNTSGYNDDWRSHTNEPGGWVDPYPGFKISMESSTGFTLEDVIIAVFKTKGSKFDTWFELFDHTEITKTGDRVTIDVAFGHGS